ncbi:hypothetical protein CC85DRAFT_14592 [Cutaneotrichosporon oleaginosum]|uniref:Uncharacterized protein n=1 Tax=Cutaneotrichosporon oleaginosum TaxID=879819 RepID=A0A0J0XCI1_9TREE|nr:uncharacterized protein CC85DRAFT_14592 [Cutaneotrichosporon oleaginosum]KLT38788.1 hypothetical protein CC85DRAFT_14592 [Cutaneotrichosporon oleaginosum]TXT09947.1 hypothetical protein COLE_03881 [Cutaneotrichosporon oleaginosum]
MGCALIGGCSGAYTTQRVLSQSHPRASVDIANRWRGETRSMYQQDLRRREWLHHPACTRLCLIALFHLGIAAVHFKSRHRA